MNNSQSWIDEIQKQVDGKTKWLFRVQDNFGKSIVLEWHMANILSPELAAFKKEVADLASRITAASEVEFLQLYPEAVMQEIFLTPCAPLFAQGVNKVDWNKVENTIQTTIKQFYFTDINTFGDQVLKKLSNDIYFFARATEQKSENLIGFCILSITPNLPWGDIKLVNIIVEPSAQHQGIEKLLLRSLFTIINPQRIFTALRSNDMQMQNMLTSCGFTVNSNPEQDPNHAINHKYFKVMDYKIN